MENHPLKIISSGEEVVNIGKFPSWLHRKLPKGGTLFQTNEVIKKKRLHTVCEEAKCPNLLECYSKKTATFLIMGRECTRACSFCDIDFSRAPKALDNDEPRHIAESVQELGLKHVVITMVARDDLSDGGAHHLVKVMEAVRSHSPDVTIEVLTSDFDGNKVALRTIIEAYPEIFNHNIETVPRLTAKVRFKATYERSLDMLTTAKEMRSEQLVKSGLMVGLGETKDEIVATLGDLAAIGVDIVTMGQYLQASRKKLPVKEYIHPDLFKEYEEIGKSFGIPYMYTGPFVRSSYNANVIIRNMTINSD